MFAIAACPGTSSMYPTGRKSPLRLTIQVVKSLGRQSTAADDDQSRAPPPREPNAMRHIARLNAVIVTLNVVATISVA